MIYIWSCSQHIYAKIQGNRYKANGYYPESHQAYGAYDAVYLYKMVVEQAYKDGKDSFNPDVIVSYLERINKSNPVTLTRVIFISLLDSGLAITASWPINIEMKARLRAKESAALA